MTHSQVVISIHLGISNPLQEGSGTKRTDDTSDRPEERQPGHSVEEEDLEGVELEVLNSRPG